MFLPFYGMLSAFFLLLVQSPLAAQTLEDPVTKVTFPLQIVIQKGENSYTLQATGMATKTRFYNKEYTVVHYMQEPPINDAQMLMHDITSDDKTKQLTIHWVRSASAQQIQDSFLEAFHTELQPRDYVPIENEINQFISLFNQPAHLDDEYVIRWLRGGIIEVKINGRERGIFRNIAFAKALWGLWFGPDSMVDSKKLTSLVLKNK